MTNEKALNLEKELALIDTLRQEKLRELLQLRANCEHDMEKLTDTDEILKYWGPVVRCVICGHIARVTPDK